MLKGFSPAIEQPSLQYRHNELDIEKLVKGIRSLQFDRTWPYESLTAPSDPAQLILGRLGVTQRNNHHLADITIEKPMLSYEKDSVLSMMTPPKSLPSKATMVLSLSHNPSPVPAKVTKSPQDTISLSPHVLTRFQEKPGELEHEKLVRSIIDRLIEEYWATRQDRFTSFGASRDSSSSSRTSFNDFYQSSAKDTESIADLIPDPAGDPPEDDGSSGAFQDETEASNVDPNRVNYACHFRKKDPSKYSVHQWPSCSRCSYSSIHRVK